VFAGFENKGAEDGSDGLFWSKTESRQRGPFLYASCWMLTSHMKRLRVKVKNQSFSDLLHIAIYAEVFAPMGSNCVLERSR
jgi:hypothetical protein